MTIPAEVSTPLSSVLSPIQVGPVRLRNRVAVPPISTYYARSGRYIEQRHVDYYRERAAGGVGLIVTEQQLAAGNTRFRDNCLTAFDPEAIPGLRAASEAVHGEGAKLFVELLQPGAWDHGTSTLEDWHVAKGPSAGWVDYLGEYVQALTRADIRQLLADMTVSAGNVAAAGVDGVEIHGAHGYLIQQFMSRELNRRDDEYGGSIANRARFAIQVGDAARAGLTDAMALGVRLSVEEFKGDQGVTSDEMMEMIDLVAASGVYDYFDISCGGFGMVHHTISPMSVGEGFLLGRGAEVKSIVGERAKVFVVGRIIRLQMANRAVADGAADVVCMARAHLADPRLVQKTQAGRADEIVRCIGVNVCSGQPMTNCMLNPVSGRDRAWGGLDPEPAPTARKVVIVGAGPAGLKAAAAAAARGHDVTVLEAAPEPGGKLNELKIYPTRGSWQNAIDDLVRIADKRGADLRVGVRADASTVRDLAPDSVVLATGARMVPASLEWVRAAEDDSIVDIFTANARVLAEPGALGRDVVIVDEVGAYAALGLAEMLAEAGARVRLVTAKAVVGQRVAAFDGPYVMPRLAALHVEFCTHTLVTERSGRDVAVRGVWGNHRRVFADVDSVVVAIPMAPDSTLIDELGGIEADVCVIGDADAPRTVREAIYEGERCGRSL